MPPQHVTAGIHEEDGVAVVPVGIATDQGAAHRGAVSPSSPVVALTTRTSWSRMSRMTRVPRWDLPRWCGAGALLSSGQSYSEQRGVREPGGNPGLTRSGEGDGRSTPPPRGWQPLEHGSGKARRPD
jgi:hypothetical protein